MINTPLTKLLFLDIETVGTEKDFFHFTKNYPRISEFFIKNRSWLDKRYPEHQDSTIEELYLSVSALIPEFGKIVCVAGFEDGKGNFVTKVISGEEKHILTETHSLLNKVQGMGFWICGHNVKSFDIPYIIKRSLMNGIKPSSLLPTPDTKPWEVKAVDTKEFWQLGNYTSLCSLDLMCASMDVESSKDGEVTGNNLHFSYWNTDSQEKINEYCEKDIKVLYQVVKKFYELNENENFQDDFNLENDEEFIQIQQELANLLEKLQNGESLEFLPGEDPFNLISSLEPSDMDTIPLGYEFLINDEELKNQITPMYNYESDSGFDLFNAGPHITIEPLGRTLVPTGIRLNIPINCEIQIRPKSGLALKQGLTVLNTPGTVDCFSEDMKILTIKGEKTINELNLNDVIFSFNEKTLEIEKDIITNIFNTEEQEIIIFETDNGILEVTPNSEVYTKRGLLLAKDVKENDEIIIF